MDGDLIIQSNAFIEKDLTVKGTSRFRNDVIIEEGDLKLESIRDTSVEENGLLMIKQNGDVVNGGVLKDLMYLEMLFPLQCATDAIGNTLYQSPYWEANVNDGMFLLKKNCMKEVRLGVGIKPSAKFHVLSPDGSTTLPILIERSAGNQSPSYKLMQLDHEGLLYARDDDSYSLEIPEKGKEFNFSVYPNPNDGRFTLEIYDKSFTEGEFEISTLYGQKIENRKIMPKNLLDFSNLSKGMYILNIKNDTQTIGQTKIIIK